MNTHKAAMKRAEWLSYCLEIGWDKKQLPGLEKIWDDYYDKKGNIKQSQQSQQPEISIEEHLKKGNTEFIGITFTADEKQPNNYLPTDDEVSNWFAENIDYECSASSAIYKFRLFLKELQSQQPKEAESDAIEFAEWIFKNKWDRISDNIFSDRYARHKTTEELYKLFKNKQ